MIPPTTIAAVKERTDIVALIGESVKLARKGRSFWGLCPFHKEKSPSFSVNPEVGFFHCFGCKESGGAIDFVMKTEGLSFPETVRRLAERAGIRIEETGTEEERREADAARKQLEDLYGVNQVAAHFFEEMLREHEHARVAHDELARRGLVATGEHATTITFALQAFRVGYAPASWDALATYLRRQGVSPTAAEKVGLIAPRRSGQGHYDFFRNRLMFAVIDVQGRVVGFSGRILPDPQTGIVDKETGKYVNSPETPIYRKGETLFGLYQARQSVRQSEEAVVVEGNFDVVSLHARGIQNVVAPLGTAFTPAQAKLLKRYAPRVVLLFDGDAAGRKATRESREPCMDAGLAVRVASLPDGKDPDEVVQKKGPDAVRAAIKAAQGLLEHLVEATLDGAAGADARVRAEKLRAVAQLLASEPDPAVRAMAKTYADAIAARLGVPGTEATSLQGAVERALSEAQGPAAGFGPVRGGDRRARPDAPDPREIALGVIGALLDFPELLEDSAVDEVAPLLEGDTALAVAALRRVHAARNPLYAAEILAHLPASLHTFASRRLAAPRHEAADEARTELQSNAQKLKRLGLSREKAEIVEALQRAGRLGDAGAEDALLREQLRRARERARTTKG